MPKMELIINIRLLPGYPESISISAGKSPEMQSARRTAFLSLPDQAVPEQMQRIKNGQHQRRRPGFFPFGYVQGQNDNVFLLTLYHLENCF